MMLSLSVLSPSSRDRRLYSATLYLSFVTVITLTSPCKHRCAKAGILVSRSTRRESGINGIKPSYLLTACCFHAVQFRFKFKHFDASILFNPMRVSRQSYSYLLAQLRTPTARSSIVPCSSQDRGGFFASQNPTDFSHPRIHRS